MVWASTYIIIYVQDNGGTLKKDGVIHVFNLGFEGDKGQQISRFDIDRSE